MHNIDLFRLTRLAEISDSKWNAILLPDKSKADLRMWKHDIVRSHDRANQFSSDLYIFMCNSSVCKRRNKFFRAAKSGAHTLPPFLHIRYSYTADKSNI